MNADEMSRVRELAERWWVPVIRGVAAILLGVALLAAPGIGLFLLIVLWGAYALVDGVANLMMAARGSQPSGSRGWLVVEGIVSLAAGVVALAWPGMTALTLLMVIAAWAVLTGVAEIVASVRLRRELRHTWPLALAGVLSIAFGVLLFAYPGSGALALIWTIGVYQIVFGAVLIGFGLHVRSWRGAIEHPTAGLSGTTPTPTHA